MRTYRILGAPLAIALAVGVGESTLSAAESQPYDRAKAHALAGSIEGVKVDMPLDDADRTLIAAGFMPLESQPTGRRGGDGPVANPCSTPRGSYPKREYRPKNPVARTDSSLWLSYSCETKRVTQLSLKIMYFHSDTVGRESPVTAFAAFADVEPRHVEICGDSAIPDSTTPRYRNIVGPRVELAAKLVCNVGRRTVSAEISNTENGVLYQSSISGHVQADYFIYSRVLYAEPVPRPRS